MSAFVLRLALGLVLTGASGLGCNNEALSIPTDAAKLPDAAPSAIDLASYPPGDGVVCGGVRCTLHVACCLALPFDGDASKWVCGEGAFQRACAGNGYLCDGVEDCALGQFCIGSGAVTATAVSLFSRCGTTLERGDQQICRTDDECKQGLRCHAKETFLPGTPPMHACE